VGVGLVLNNLSYLNCGVVGGGNGFNKFKQIKVSNGWGGVLINKFKLFI